MNSFEEVKIFQTLGFSLRYTSQSKEQDREWIKQGAIEFQNPQRKSTTEKKKKAESYVNKAGKMRSNKGFKKKDT